VLGQLVSFDLALPSTGGGVIDKLLLDREPGA